MPGNTMTEAPHKIRAEEIRQAAQKKYWRVKRLLDILFSLAAIALCIPLFLLISLLVYIDDPHGSPFYSQTRLGLEGKAFTMYKFRTMSVDAEARQKELAALNEMDGPVFKIRNDPRITRMGRILRKTSLDELPQLFNVLLGDMSVIGPRPPLPWEAAEYTDYQRLRLCVKPGLSCYWQVRADRNKLSFSEWIDLDMNYILHASLWEDVKLILKTPFVMLRGEGC